MIRVSNHAIQRYVERVGGSETEAYEALTAPLFQQAGKAGIDCEIRLPSGNTAVVKNSVVVTVRPKRVCRIRQKFPKKKRNR